MYTHEQISSFIEQNTFPVSEHLINQIEKSKIEVADLICGDGRHPEKGKVSIFGQSVGLLVAGLHAAREQHDLEEAQLCALFDHLVASALDGTISHHTHEADPDNCHKCGHIGQLLAEENHEHYGLCTITARHIQEHLEVAIQQDRSHKYVLSGEHEEVVIIEEVGDHHISLAHQNNDAHIKQTFVYSNTKLVDTLCTIIDTHISYFLEVDQFTGTKEKLLDHTTKTALALAPGMQVFSYDASKDELTYKTTLPVR